MLVKLTSKNRLTLPKTVISEVESTDYFEVTVQDGSIILTPVRINRANSVHAKLVELGVTKDDISDAITWARTQQQ